MSKRKQIVLLTQEEADEVDRKVEEQMVKVAEGSLPRWTSSSTTASKVIKRRPMAAASKPQEKSIKKSRWDNVVPPSPPKSTPGVWEPPSAPYSQDDLQLAWGLIGHSQSKKNETAAQGKREKLEGEWKVLINIFELYKKQKGNMSLLKCAQKVSSDKDGARWKKRYQCTILPAHRQGVQFRGEAGPEGEPRPSEEMHDWYSRNVHDRHWGYVDPRSKIDKVKRPNIDYQTRQAMYDWAEKVNKDFLSSVELPKPWPTECPAAERLWVRENLTADVLKLIDNPQLYQQTLATVKLIIKSANLNPANTEKPSRAHGYILVAQPSSSNIHSWIYARPYGGETEDSVEDRYRDHYFAITIPTGFKANKHPELYTYLADCVKKGKNIYMIRVLPQCRMKSSVGFLVEHLLISFFQSFSGNFNRSHGTTSKIECPLAKSIPPATKILYGAALFIESVSLFPQDSQPLVAAQ